MLINIKNVDINYIQYGNKKGKNLILLHGWKQNIEMMMPIGNRLKDDYYITIIDLPGHGESSEPNVPWTLFDYVEALKLIIKQLKIKNPSLLGHSFGGRISIIYAAKNKIDKLILCASPYRKKQNIKFFVKLKMKFLKFLKKVPFLKPFENWAKNKIGSRDYKAASPVMKKILVNTVNEDLTEYAKLIKSPTILIWGTNDQEAPYSEGINLNNLIKDSAIIEYKNNSHFAYLENTIKTVNIIKSLIGKEDKND